MDLPALSQAIMAGQRVEAVAQTRQAIDAGLTARDILDTMVAAMDAIGRRFQNHEIFVPIC
jgi:methanogenic corrinoid protein MtbC1